MTTYQFTACREIQNLLFHKYQIDIPKRNDQESQYRRPDPIPCDLTPFLVTPFLWEQKEFDYYTQDPVYGPLHAMSRLGQKRQAARDEANTYIRNQLCLARKLQSMGMPEQALPYLARAIHTLQDSTSQPHSNFQSAWGDSNFWHLDHYILEGWVLPANAQLAQTRTKEAFRFYKGSYAGLPSDFFPTDSFDTNAGPVSVRFPGTSPTNNGGGPCGCN